MCPLNLGDLVWAYDAVGNRSSQNLDTGAGAQTDVYTYPATSNRLLSISLGAGGSRALTHDAAGNVTSDNRAGGRCGHSYDDKGRMASFAINGVVQADHDPTTARCFQLP